MEWFNQPPQWTAQGDTITVTTGPQTDFWRKSHDGGVRDTGHFYYQQVTGDFTAEVKFSGQYGSLYDHAGLMIRLDEATWLKCGIEYFNEIQNVSAVITHDYSDWSVLPLSANPPAIWLRIVRTGSTVEVYYALDGEKYTMVRQGYLTHAPTVNVGLMCAAPKGNGFTTVFDGFKVRGT